MRKLYALFVISALSIAPLGLSTGCSDKEEHKVEATHKNMDGSETRTKLEEKTTVGKDGATKHEVTKTEKTEPASK